jgi:hypothetical protein
MRISCQVQQTLRQLLVHSLAVSAWMAGAAVASAQGAPPALAGPGTIAGVVRDTAGRPLEDADVLVLQLQARVRTRADGSFLFSQLKPGKYTLEARHIGYKPMTAKVTVKDSGAVLAFRMQRTTFSLPARVTIATRGGLSGVVADTGFRPLGGVKVTVNGANLMTETDSAGAFFVPAKAGQYLVVLKRSGYARQIVSVTVPVDSGRNIAAWMVPEKHDSDPRLGANLFDQAIRLNRASPATSKFFSREDIDRLGFKDLRAIGSYASGRLMNPDCPVMEDGDPRKTLPLWAIEARDLEFVEAYIDLGARATVNPSGAGAASKLAANKREMSAVPSSPCGVTLVVWWRR